MKIQDVMTTDVNWISPDMTVHEAARMMRDKDIGSLPIGENDRLVGMVTDRDLAIRCLAEGRDVDKTTVRDVMSKKLLYCKTTDEIVQVAANMAQNLIRRLPVVDENKRLVGIVSLGDLARRGAAKESGEALAKISKSAA